MKYIIALGEGQSERGFLDRVLGSYIMEQSGMKYYVQGQTVLTKSDSRKGRTYHGGVTSYSDIKNDLLRNMGTGKPLTTMIDFFRLPNDFPGYVQAMDGRPHLDAVKILEQELIANQCFNARFACALKHWFAIKEGNKAG